MSLRAWRTASASVAGTSHVAAGVPCQDVGRCEVIQDRAGSDILVAMVADGAGSAMRSQQGANLTVISFLDMVSASICNDAGGLAFLDRAFVLRWLAVARAAIAEQAALDGFMPRDYACTFLGAVIGPESAAYIQIGDGAIVVTDEDDGEPVYVFWPQHGEFANTTCFVTQDDAGDIILFEKADFEGEHSYVREVALFSDGLERLVLDFTTRTVFSPALKPIFAWLATTDPVDSARPSEVLQTYLASNHVNRRTDDDKTLVMATRAQPLGGTR